MGGVNFLSDIPAVDALPSDDSKEGLDAKEVLDTKDGRTRAFVSSSEDRCEIKGGPSSTDIRGSGELGNGGNVPSFDDFFFSFGRVWILNGNTVALIGPSDAADENFTLRLKLLLLLFPFLLFMAHS